MGITASRTPRTAGGDKSKGGLFALAGLLNLFVRQWGRGTMFIGLGLLYAALSWRVHKTQNKTSEMCLILLSFCLVVGQPTPI